MLINMVLPGAVEVETARLPKEYQEVEYIQSSGTQYIDTRFIVNATDTISWEFIALIPSQSDAYMGANGYMQVHVTPSGVGVSTLNPSGLGTKKTFRIDFSNSIAKLYIDNALVETKNWSGSYSDSNVKLGIFRLGDSGNTWHASTGLVSCTLYEYSIKVGGNTVSHCVPCYRKSDNVAGVYDLVNGVFRGNEGTGAFIAGPEVSETAPSFPYTGNYTDNRIEGEGTVRLNTSGTLTVTGSPITVTATIVGGGGGAQIVAGIADSTGRWGAVASGGGGGNQIVEVELVPGTYEIVIGTGGVAAQQWNSSTTDGGNTTAFGYTSNGGGRAYSSNNGGSIAAGTGGSPNGGNGSVLEQQYVDSLNLAGGSPNGGAIVNGVAQPGGDGYVELTFI